jgi:type IV pilus assembly protein PilB
VSGVGKSRRPAKLAPGDVTRESQYLDILQPAQHGEGADPAAAAVSANGNGAGPPPAEVVDALAGSETPVEIVEQAVEQAAGEARPAEPEAPGVPRGLTPAQRRGRGTRFVADVVVDLGFMTREQVDALLERARAEGKPPEKVLVGPDGLTSDQFARVTAERFGLDHVDLTLFKPDVAAVNLITPEVARRHTAVPVGYDGDTLLVAMAQPTNVHAIDDLKMMTGLEIRRVVASPEDIAKLISRMSSLEDAVAAAIEEDEESDEPQAAVTEIRESAEDAPVIKLVNSVIAQAVDENASDIHFEPEGRDMRVRFRIDGVLVESTTIPRRMVPGVISRVKIMGQLDIAERRIPQDGRTSVMVAGRPLDIRIVTMPSVHGEGVVMRILDKSQALHTLDTLGMGDHARGRFESAFRQSYGAVLATGPTGSGKSTTLYAALNALNSPERNIITIEDPVEYQLQGVNQVQVHVKAGLTFATGLRSMLRADPDVIMVGEIRDAETARIAVESALTGHLVLSTLHTNDAASAMTRLTEMGIAPFLTASAVDCVLAQRLVRRLCTDCKLGTLLTPEMLAAAGFDDEEAVRGYEAVGCPRCNDTGFRGRIGLYEVMTVSEEIRGLTIERASADVINRVAVEQGMHTLREDGLEKVKSGDTSIGEVARVT